MGSKFLPLKIGKPQFQIHKILKWCKHTYTNNDIYNKYCLIHNNIQESTFSVHRVEFDPDVIGSRQDPLKCQNSEVLSKWDQFYESSFLHRLLLHSLFHFVFEGLS